MILSTEGDEKSFKSTVAFTGPLPEVAFCFDLGYERAIKGVKHEWFDGLKINIIKYEKGNNPVKPWTGYDLTIIAIPSPMQFHEIIVKGYTEAYQWFQALYVEAIMDPYVKSIAVDTMTKARTMRINSHLQGLQEDALDAHGNIKPNKRLREQLIQIEYGPPNDAIRNLYELARLSEKDLIATHHLTDLRQDILRPNGNVDKDVVVGRRLEGEGKTYQQVDVAIRFEKIYPTNGITSVPIGPATIKHKIQVCGYDTSLEGAYLPEMDLTWDRLTNWLEDKTEGRFTFHKRNGVKV